MAKFFITNNQDWYKQTKERISKSDYSLAFDYFQGGVYALTTHKLKINNVNSYIDENGDFAIATGTAIYKESLDYSVLLGDCKREGVPGGGAKPIRDNTIGHYAYAIKLDDIVCVFGDAVGAYNIFYYNKNGKYYISNVLYDMAKVLRDEVSVNENNVLECAIRRSILCNETFFNEIYRLGGDEMIEINKGIFTVSYNPNEWPILINANQTETAQNEAIKIKKKAQILSDVLGTPNICMTGGLDSRMSLAAYLSVGAKPTLSFGVSNTHIAFPEEKDADIVRQMADKCDLRANIMDWDTRYPDKDWDKYLARYGFLYYLWGGCDCIMKFFENQNEKLCTQGYGGEMYRNLPFTEGRNTEMTLEEFSKYYFPQEYSSELNEHVLSKLRRIASKYGIDAEHIKPEDVFYFYLEYRKFADTTTMNFVNLIRYSELLLMERDVLLASRVPCKLMDNSRFMLEIMCYLNEKVLDVPIFSHRELRKFDKDSMMLYSGIDAYRSDNALKLKNIYLKAKTILRPLRNFYKKIEKRKPVIPKKIELESIYHVNSEWNDVINVQLNIQEPTSKLYHIMELKALYSIVSNR